MHTLLNKAFGHRGYLKFAVITRSRTGSNLLVNALRTHPNLKVFGELFRGGAPAATKEAVLRSAAGYFDEHVFTSQPRSVRAVGFKIFYQHPVWDPSGAVWKCMRDTPDLHVIHLRRHNLLRVLVSRQIAKRSDVWKETGTTPAPGDKRVTLTPEQCTAFFEESEAAAERTDSGFSAHPLLQLSYEEMISDWSGQMTRVQEFLGVPPLDLAQTTTRQNPEPLSALITDFDALRTALADTRYAAFFA
jgi:LPS sulfotransferase NodH